MSRRLLIAVVAVVFCQARIADNIGIGQIGRSGTSVVGTTGRTSVQTNRASHHSTINWAATGNMPSKTVSRANKSGTHRIPSRKTPAQYRETVDHRGSSAGSCDAGPEIVSVQPGQPPTPRSWPGALFENDKRPRPEAGAVRLPGNLYLANGLSILHSQESKLRRDAKVKSDHRSQPRLFISENC